MGAFINSFADGQTNTRGPKVKLKENDGRENEAYLYKESWALVIGVSNYDHWTPLPGVQKDVERVGTALEKHGFKIQYLLNPTRQEFKTTIDEFINERGLDFENRLMIYFAGHGVTLKGPDNREEGYLVMRDTPLSEPNETSFIQKAAPIGWMERYAKDIKSKHALFVFDSCFSGKLFEDLRKRGDPSTGDLIKPVRQFITAGTANQRVPVKSIFCDYFVRALDGGADSNNDGLVTGTELGEYLKRRVTEDSRRSDAPQTPMVGKIADPKLSQGDFVFALPGRPSKVVEVASARDDDVGAPAAREELRNRGVGTDVSSVKNALMSVDVDVLNLLSAASLPSTVIEEAFRQKAGAEKTTVARRFFENSSKSPGAIKWFDSALANGVNPNLTVVSDYYEREGILLEAIRAAHVPAIKSLLERGASPHAYQNLFLTGYSLTRFLYPLRYIAGDDRLSLEEKQVLTRAFITAGVVVPKVIDPGQSGWPSVMYEAKQFRDEDAAKLGMNLPASRPFCEQQENPICKHAGADWCSIINKMPNKLAFEYGKNSSSPLYDVTLLHLLNIEENKAYFLGLTRYITYEYVLVEVSKDASSWTILRFMSPESGMGLCKKDDNGYQPEYCWRRIPIRRVAATDEMRFAEWGLSWRLTREDCSSLYPKDIVKK